MKQHINSKHTAQINLPIGHPERITESMQNMKFLCAICGQTFAVPTELETHVVEHAEEEKVDGFSSVTTRNIICRYFKRGYCSKGDQCNFKHEKSETNSTPSCRRGRQCSYLKKNKCSFFHPGIGV